MCSLLSTPDIEKQEALDEAQKGEQQEEKEPPYKVMIHNLTSLIVIRQHWRER